MLSVNPCNRPLAVKELIGFLASRIEHNFDQDLGQVKKKEIPT
jgi:hypothetical protein